MLSLCVPLSVILCRYCDQGNPKKCSKECSSELSRVKRDNLLILDQHFLQTCEYQYFREDKKVQKTDTCRRQMDYTLIFESLHSTFNYKRNEVFSCM